MPSQSFQLAPIPESQPRSTSLPNPLHNVGYFPPYVHGFHVPRRRHTDTSETLPYVGSVLTQTPTAMGNADIAKGKDPTCDQFSGGETRSLDAGDGSMGEDRPTQRRKTASPTSPVNMDTRDPQQVLEDRRRRNATASARFRTRRKEREQQLRQRCVELEQRVHILETALLQYQQRFGAVMPMTSDLPPGTLMLAQVPANATLPPGVMPVLIQQPMQTIPPSVSASNVLSLRQQTGLSSHFPHPPPPPPEQ